MPPQHGSGREQLVRDLGNFILGTWVRAAASAQDNDGSDGLLLVDEGLHPEAAFTVTFWDDLSCNSEEAVGTAVAHQAGEYSIDLDALEVRVELAEGTVVSGELQDPHFAQAPARSCRLDLEAFVQRFRRLDGGTHWELALARAVDAALQTSSRGMSRSCSFGSELSAQASALGSDGAEPEEEEAWQLARQAGPPTAEVRLARTRVLQMCARAGRVRTAAEAMEEMAQLGSFLSEFVFFTRFYKNEGLQVTSDLFAARAEDAELWGGDVDPTTAWRLTMQSKLSEYTGCGHFASVLRDNVYYASANLAREAALAHPAATPARLCELLRQRPNASFLIRVEWSVYDTKERDRAVRMGKTPEATDFHAYLLDVPAAPAGTSDQGGWRPAYLLQSLWYHYDASVQPLSADGLRRHCQHLASFDGQTPHPAPLHHHFAGRYFYGAPLTAVRPDGATHRPPELDEQEERRLARLQGGRQMVAVLDVFTVYSYDPAAAVERILAISEEAFGRDALGQHVAYGAGRREPWGRVLDIVYHVNAASQAAADSRGTRRMLCIGAFL